MPRGCTGFGGTTAGDLVSFYLQGPVVTDVTKIDNEISVVIKNKDDQILQVQFEVTIYDLPRASPGSRNPPKEILTGQELSFDQCCLIKISRLHLSQGQLSDTGWDQLSI